MAARRPRLRLLVLLLASLGGFVLFVLLSCPRQAPRIGTEEPAAAPASSEERPLAGQPPAEERVPVSPKARETSRLEGRLAIIIDDAGYDLSQLEPFLELHLPVGIAVLPHLPASAETGRRVVAAGKELLLHLPMEPEGAEHPGEGALLTGQPAEETERLLASAVASVGDAVGVNNHMGSRATADPQLMETVLAALKRQGLFFVDSRTTAATVGRLVAERLGTAVLERNVFLDPDGAEAGAEQALAAAIAVAARDGAAVAIGHVQTPGLAAILARSAAALASAGVRVVPPSQLLPSPRGGAE